ncbi:non-specific serine/threonine protein kinase [Malassezia vespertilionis]|uniref:non-specific serine/threonine protein kinase n=1 Tax=Malassezia vespertilionis TaxID=2020962 RepID=UPI0024B1ECDF|nr:non-specific serine/threonine protein kinase [Malassezia vespertilionis]WFD07437.1 non-specific serine/threonine protein kinase [Malassezia vespertilionis]
MRNKLSPKLLENLEGEISILTSMRHTNIVDLRDCVYSDEFIHLIMEYCPGGDLSQYIRQHGDVAPWDGNAAANPLAAEQRRLYPHPIDGGLNDAMVRSFFAQLASALRFLRSRDIVHRDIKPQNLLLRIPDEECLASGHPRELPQIKVADFGFARSLPAASLAKTLCGSPLYMAPEILRYEKYDAKADLWSVGAVLYEMSVGKPPFRATNHVELLRRIEQSNDRIKFPDERSPQSLARDAARRKMHGEQPRPTPHDVAPDIKALIRSLLKRHPVERMSFDEFFHDDVIVAVPYSGRAILKDDLAASLLSEKSGIALDADLFGMSRLETSPPLARAEAPLEDSKEPDTVLASRLMELPINDASRALNTAFGFKPGAESEVSNTPGAGKMPPNALNPSALSRAISMAGGRLASSGTAPAQAKSLDALDTAPFSEQDLAAVLHGFAQKAYVLHEFADARLAECNATVRMNTNGLSPVDSSPNSAALHFQETVVAESLALYVRALGFLQRGLFAVNGYAENLEGAEPSEAMRSLAHWFRSQFDECYEKSVHARAALSADVVPDSVQNLDRQIFDKALELARSAAVDELEGNCEQLDWDTTNCVLAYETAAALLLGLLDPGEDALGLSVTSVSTVEKFLKSINKRLSALQSVPVDVAT